MWMEYFKEKSKETSRRRREKKKSEEGKKVKLRNRVEGDKNRRMEHKDEREEGRPGGVNNSERVISV